MVFQMRSLFLLFLLLFCCKLGFSQSEREVLEQLKKSIRQATLYDSSEVFSKGNQAIQLARKLKSHHNEGLIYQYYGNFYYYSNRYDKAKKYYNQSIRLARKHKDIRLENSTKIRLAFILAEKDELAGEKEFERLLIIANRNELIENQIEILNGFGILYENRMQSDKAMDYYLKGLRIAEKNNKNYFIAFLLNNIGLLKFENKQYKGAEEDLERGLVLAQKEKEWRLVGNLLNNLGLVNKQLKDYKSSILHYKETVKLTKKLGFPYGIGAAYINLADAFALNKQFKEANACQDSAIAIFSQFENFEYLEVAYLAKATIAIQLKNANEAEKYIQQVEVYLKQAPHVENSVDLIEVKSLLAALKGDYKTAFELKNQFSDKKDSIEEITNQDKLHQLQTIYGKEQVENELAEVRNKNKLFEQQKALDDAYWRLIIFIVLGVSLLVLGGLYMRYLYNMRKQQKDFSQRLIQNVDNERSRISKDLHDDIGQLLSVVKSKINMFQTGRLHSIDGLEKEVGEVINQTRSISHELHPSSLEKIGIERSVISLLEKTQDATGIICSSEISGDLKQLPLELQTQLYRIFQECITNTIKHAGASALKITLICKEDQITASFRDNGVGFEEQEFKSGLGWLTIKERIHQIDGKMDLQTGKGKGVHLTIKIKTI